VTADSFGTAENELAGIAEPYILRTARHDAEKANDVTRFELPDVTAFGNGRNDRLMLKTVKEGGGLAVAVDNGEGCALDAMLNADLLEVGAGNAIDLLLHPVRLKATLRS
jgi:soluble P-type ATPase